MSIRVAALESSAIAEFRGQSTAIELQVTTDPAKMAPRVFGDFMAATSYSFLGQATLLDNRYRLRIPIRVIASTVSVKGLLPGQKIRVEGKVLKSKELLNHHDGLKALQRSALGCVARQAQEMRVR